LGSQNRNWFFLFPFRDFLFSSRAFFLDQGKEFFVLSCASGIRFLQPGAKLFRVKMRKIETRIFNFRDVFSQHAEQFRAA